MSSKTITQPSSVLLESWADRLPNFWADDCWRVSEWFCEGEGTASQVMIAFGQLPDPLQDELKFVCWQKLAQKEWNFSKPPGPLDNFKRLIWYLEETRPQVSSMLDRTVAQWELSIRTFFVEQGNWRGRQQHRINAAGDVILFERNDPVFYALHATLKKLNAAYDEANGTSEYDKDVWDVRRLGFLETPGTNKFKLNFTAIQQPWLSRVAKQFCRYWLLHNSMGDCLSKLKAVRDFSRYLVQKHPSISPERLNRMVMLDYIAWLSSRGLAAGTIVAQLSSVSVFIQTCGNNGWVKFPQARLVYNDDLPRKPKRKPKFIPEEVRKQLIDNIDALPLHFARMVLIMDDTGMRISECLSLTHSSLQTDQDGDWVLRFHQHKGRKDHVVPIAEAVADAIKAQTADVRAKWGDTTEYLFPSNSTYHNAVGKPFNVNAFNDALNRIAHALDIRDATGQRFHYHSHQFRHTVATRLLNKGVPMPVIQKYLNITSADTAAGYAELHDQTVLAEFLKYIGQTVDINGTKINDSPDDPSLAWMRHQVLEQTLPNGRCGLPPTEKCPHGNACLTCTNFRTDKRYLPLHLKQRDETRQLIEAARAQGLERQAEASSQVERSLTNIITALEQLEGE